MMFPALSPTLAVEVDMKTRILGWTILSLLGAALAGDQQSSVDPGWQTYVDSTYNVMMRFPAELRPYDPEAYSVHFEAEPRPHGPTGDFQLLLVDGGGTRAPEESCKGEAPGKLQPFGPNPTIRRMKVDGQSACLVSSSQEKNEAGASWYAAVFVRNPTPIEMDGIQYNLLEIIGDKDYVTAIARTLKFISSGHESPPLLLKIAPSTNATPPGTATWKAGAPVFLTVAITNNTRQVLHFPFAKPGADYQLNLDDGSWKSRFDEEHLQLKREREGALADTQNEVTLKPQEMYRKTMEVGSLLMPCSKPGKYTVEMQMKLPAELGKGLVRSNTVTITVSE